MVGVVTNVGGDLEGVVTNVGGSTLRELPPKSEVDCTCRPVFEAMHDFA